ncbi:hypothetical protein BU24DRAFT_404168 [Aaosphaeria arxii CBS 175.79]|uniref:Uncharacterized protein n=1 Tax=Aaosphaeria arxii CBS 175.79 TaxID=1450172 RepID=A0A6A5Y8Q0_9PLEO|nr:uncharacterized protein BU24DRAFT_404168 [Aaosphaeria arxii CBS 175.79]KAF2021121.1 hypothetical protein BU24DRAFT_404168 [Aaosphaeria arxii CBS 175.79]
MPFTLSNPYDSVVLPLHFPNGPKTDDARCPDKQGCPMTFEQYSLAGGGRDNDPGAEWSNANMTWANKDHYRAITDGARSSTLYYLMSVVGVWYGVVAPSICWSSQKETAKANS